MKLFGLKKSPVKPNLMESIQKLRDAEQVLEKREKHLEKQINLALQDAKKKSQAKDKRGALFQLKKKKMYEKEIEQIFGKKSNIEIQILALENAGLTGEVITAMQGGEQSLRQVFAQHKIDKVEDVMESITEAMEDFEELNDVLSQPIGPPIDEDELENELNELEESLANDQSVVSLSQQNAHKDKLKDELSELEVLMGTSSLKSPLPMAEVVVEAKPIVTKSNVIEL